ncbi:MAG TPA: NADAR family protein [Dongiaceae bacterium]|jgi:ribA/ribD-fused uncharacterized protein|nr:NADAR family protein [Dongiaceae bacterium]
MNHEIRFFDPRHEPYSGLSNLFERPLELDGIPYLTAEHAYQAAKARDALVRAWIMAAPTPELSAVAGDALAAEQTVPGWSGDHVRVMSRILRAKYDQHPDLKDLLLSTGEAKLVEWSPQDGAIARFWGEYQGQGENTLGRMLMELRAGYRQGRR